MSGHSSNLLTRLLFVDMCGVARYPALNLTFNYNVRRYETEGLQVKPPLGFLLSGNGLWRGQMEIVR